MIEISSSEKPRDEEVKTTLNMKMVKDIGAYLADKYPEGSEHMEKIIKVLQGEGPGNAFLIGMLKQQFPGITMEDIKTWKKDILDAYLIALQDVDRTQFLSEDGLGR